VPIEITESATAQVGIVSVRRALPRRQRRMIGAWCFADHMGPADATPTRGLDVGPHPHCGLQTVTWLTQGEVLHRDSLGTEQVIAPGQLNLMTAGRGVSHSEEATGSYAGPVEGIQLWMAQPAATRDGDAAFEHHASLPSFGLAGSGRATVLVGALGDVESPARIDSPMVGAELVLDAVTSLDLDPAFEHGLVVLDGAVEVDGSVLTPGHLGYLAPGQESLALAPEPTARVMLLGGVPFPEEITMWWNYVIRDRAEATAAHRSWLADDGRFGTVESALERVIVDLPPWA
jgi:redox-sensitive bicupin YhaK (pirin superfamily)